MMRMRKLSTREAIENLIRVLVLSGKKVNSAKWQATEIGKNNLIEVEDLFFKMLMIDDSTRLAELTGADLPWAEDHFQERLAGPSNPGEQYKNWPYWDFSKQVTEFTNGDKKFSHTYQERFWPYRATGYRFSAGNWSDVKDRLCNDVTTRQAFLAIWHPEDQSNNGVRVPCSIGYWFKVTSGQLNITYLIRSCDARRHLRNDIYMAQRLASEMVQHLNSNGHDLVLGDMSMWIGSLHCFQSDLYTLKKYIQ